MSKSMTLFQFESNAGPAKSLVALGVDNALGEGIRSSYAIMGIKAGRFRVKYKGVEHLVQKTDPDTGQLAPVSSIEVVIVKANPFLNKQYYAGKYAEGSNSPPDCYSLDGKVPSPSVQKPVFSNCVMCPKNQFGSLVSDTGVKQKACRDTKKLAIVPLQDLRNESMGGPMLFRVPPSALKDLSSLADAMKARGYPYNGVAVRIGFDMEASHPKPTFSAIRPLTDAEGEVVFELYQGDGVAAVLADNDVAVDVPVAQPASTKGGFEQEPVVVPVGTQATAPQAPVYQAPPPPPASVQTQQPAFVAAAPAAEAPTQFVAAPVAPPPPGMQGAVVQPFVPGAAPVNPFAPPPAAAAVAPVAAPKPKKAKPVVQIAEPVMVEPSEEPSGSTLNDDIGNILAGLSAFTAKA
jgi:hypothetical protein